MNADIDFEKRIRDRIAELKADLQRITEKANQDILSYRAAIGELEALLKSEEDTDADEHHGN